jgi:hypothetical protein
MIGGLKIGGEPKNKKISGFAEIFYISRQDQSEPAWIGVGNRAESTLHRQLLFIFHKLYGSFAGHVLNFDFQYAYTVPAVFN